LNRNYASAFREFVAERRLGGADVFTVDEILAWFSRHHPGMGDALNQLLKKTTNYAARVRWRPRPGADDMFFQVSADHFRLYRAGVDPQPIYGPESSAGCTTADGLNRPVSKDIPYNPRNCQSLLGYAKKVHEWSGGVCLLCGYGAGLEVDFDLWRQLSVEHLIGKSQGGYLDQIRLTVRERFPSHSHQEQTSLSIEIDALNTVTACQFCNSTTSQAAHPRSMTDIILVTRGGPDEVLRAVAEEASRALENKRSDVAWKLRSLREAFEREVKGVLAKART
jgi:hypothetical protein